MLELPPKLQLWLRRTRKNTVLGSLLSLLREPFRILSHGPRRWSYLRQAWGWYPRASSAGCVWIHAVGPGEVRVAIALVSALPSDMPVVITTFSEGGRKLAERVLGERVEFAWLPFFFRFAVRGFLRRFSPRQLVVIEVTDLSPLLCLHVARHELPTALINGWFHQEGFDKDPHTPLLGRIQVFGVQSEEDRERLAGIGIARERAVVTGEMKFDVVAEPLPDLQARIRQLAGGRPILIAGSTHPPEDPQVLDAFERLGGGGRALLLLASRQLTAESTERLLRERGIDFVRRSRLPDAGRPAVVLLDSHGELASLYRLGTAAFIGCSLFPGGRGHNPIEPAVFGVPFAVGPHMINFRLHADLFERAGAWQRVHNAGELAQVWAAWLDDPELARQTGQRAADLVASQRGIATARTLELLGLAPNPGSQL